MSESESELEFETPEAMERALNLVAARRSGGSEAYYDKLQQTYEQIAGDAMEIARTMHALARIASMTIRRLAIHTDEPPARTFQGIAEMMMMEPDTEDEPDESSPG
jgi:hypothetical protein